MPNPYARDVSGIKTLDPYRLQELYNMHPCAEHVVKKLLVAGEREGGKDLDHDISDCIRTLTRWQEMRAEDRKDCAPVETRYNWAVVPARFGFVATDMDGGIYMYEQEPQRAALGWKASGASFVANYPSSTPQYLDTPAWHESLEARP